MLFFMSFAYDFKKGWKDGTKITFAGEGDQESPHSRPGDMIFIIKTKHHERFVRDGQYLIHKISIPLVRVRSFFRCSSMLSTQVLRFFIQ